MKMTIQSDFPAVQKMLGDLQADVARQATARALNRTVEQAKTAMSREIRSQFVLPAARVNEALRINKASATGGAFRLEAELFPQRKKGRSINLAAFDARKVAKGWSFRIRRDGPRQLIPGAFMINNGKTMMIRVGKSRLPIKALQTIDVAQMFNTKRINAKVVELIRAKFPEIFEREAKFYTDRFNSRGRA